uniref:Conserved oligomeric Golgi complex subunit 2 n=1 Tax=Trypanosoma congolense (strain IL3000) TaxID=1068625 RepID=G0V1W2_TRYCI|nr:unnamed protein product [Trypanosoma congolense IL3000]
MTDTFHAEDREEQADLQEDVSQPLDDLDQLQLLQLCFGEMEFGVVLDGDQMGGRWDGVTNDEMGGSDGVGMKEKVDSMVEDASSALSVYDFDPVQFVRNKLCHGVSLDVLCRDLETYTTLLNKILLRHVNTDVHDAFVKVSGHLVGMQGDLRLLQQPVVTAVRKIEDNVAKLRDMESCITSKIAEATEIELTRIFDVGFLKILLLNDLLMEKVESLPASLCLSMDEKQHYPNYQHLSFSRVVAAMGTGAHIREAFLDFAELVRQMRSLQQTLPILSQREQEHAEVDKILHSSTQMVYRVCGRVYLATYEEFLQSPREEIRESMLHMMKAYEQMDGVHEFCRMYRERMLRPLLESILSWRAATQARHSLVDTIKLLATLKQQLEKSVLPLISLVREAFDAKLLPIPTMVCPVLFESLLKKMISLYDAGDPDAFQQRYIAAHEVLYLMEKSCTSEEEVRALRCCPDVVLWEQRWNTDVYGAMRVNTSTRKLNDAIGEFTNQGFDQHAAEIEERRKHQNSEIENSAVNMCFSIDLFSKLQENIEWLFSRDVYIYAVTPRFLREVASSTRRVVTVVVGQCKASLSGTSLQGWLSVTVTASADISKLAVYLEGPFRQRLHEVGGQTVNSTVSTTFLELLIENTCSGALQELHQLMHTRVIDECGVGLQNIRSVKSIYTHTRKPLPTAPSWYVTSIVEPVRHFCVGVQNRLAPEEARAAVMNIVVEVVDRFRAIAKDMLVTVKKTEESWEKLRRRKEQASASSPTSNRAATVSSRPTAETATDRDKMTLQLYFDARALVDEVKAMLESLTAGGSVGIEEQPSVVALLKLLARANWILGGEEQEPPDVDEISS